MPQWYYQRPPEAADSTERIVADGLNELAGEWTIRWGWYYEDNQGKQREGDFLILGPGGHLLVLEVKGTGIRAFAQTGHWEGGDGRDPVEQLEAQWKAAIKMLETQMGGEAIPFVHRAFACPNLKLPPGSNADGLPPERVADANALNDFAHWWSLNVANRENRCTKSRDAFLRTFAKGISPASLKLFISDSEKIFDRFKSAELSLLKRVWPNRQLLVKGGPGTGKTFMALQTAKHFAEADEGNDVLFVCYNYALADQITKLARRVKLDRGTITVRLWEQLATDALAANGTPLPRPEAPGELANHYDNEVPNYLRLLVEEGKVAPCFDALVIDEAQDLDTRYPPDLPGDADKPGWWHFLFSLLREGAHARAALFFDPAQRPAFRPDRFHMENLLPCFSQPAIVHLDRALRFTRPIYSFLREAAGDPAHALFDGLLPHLHAPEGPAVEVWSAAQDGTVAAVESILKGWIQSGLCKTKDICILGLHKTLEGSSLKGQTEVSGCPLKDYPVNSSLGDDPPARPLDTLYYLSLNRAKGLDFLAVILIDTPHSKPMEFLLAATRARQMLAVVKPIDNAED